MTQNKTIKSQIEELKKGEGITKEEIVFILEQIYKKDFVGRILDNPNGNLICYYDLFSFLSKAKLSTFQEAQKEVEAKDFEISSLYRAIEELKTKNKEAQKMFLEEIDRRLNSIRYRIRTGFGTKEEYIGEIETLQELKSRIEGENDTK